MRIGLLKVSWEEKRNERILLIAEWRKMTKDSWLISELKWIEKKALTVSSVPKDDKAKAIQSACAYKRNAAIRQEIQGGNMHKKPWTAAEDDIVINSKLIDPEIAKLLGRSYTATQKRRHKLRKLGIMTARVDGTPNVGAKPKTTAAPR